MHYTASPKLVAVTLYQARHVRLSLGETPNKETKTWTDIGHDWHGGQAIWR